MKIKSFTYQAVKNLGNYESERFEATAQIDEGEDIRQAALYLRRWVNSLFSEPRVIETPPSLEDDF